MSATAQRPFRARRACLVFVVASVLVLSACRTAVDVAVDVEENGSGQVTVTVELDAEAAAALGGPEELALDDVRASGWEVTEPEVNDDGAFSVAAVRGFADEAELTDVLADVAGEEVFASVSDEVENGFGQTRRSASMDVTVSGDPAQFSDDQLTEVLGGLPLGRTPEELAVTGVGSGSGTLTVNLQVPGGELDTAELDLTSGSPQEVSLSSETTDYRTMVIASAALGVLMLLTAVVMAVVALVRSRRR